MLAEPGGRFHGAATQVAGGASPTGGGPRP